MPPTRVALLLATGLLSCGGEAPKILAPAPCPEAETHARKSAKKPAASASSTDPATPAEPPAVATLTTAMIPMRDGVKLETVIVVPKDAKGPLPILFLRDPYGVPKDDSLFHDPAAAALVA